MATLDPAEKKRWKAAIAAVEEPWIVCGLEHEAGRAYATMDGVVGLLDWSAHGQISRLLRAGQLGPQNAAILPGDPIRRRASVLLFPVAAGVPALAKKIVQLGANDLALAAVTFPEDFLAKLKQTLGKEGIRCTTLEPGKPKHEPS